MLIAKGSLVELVWNTTTIICVIISCVMSSRISYTVTYKHASGLIACGALYLRESLCPSFTSRIFSVQCIGVFSWMYVPPHHKRHKPKRVSLNRERHQLWLMSSQLHLLTNVDQSVTMCDLEKQWCHIRSNIKCSMHSSYWFLLHNLDNYELCWGDLWHVQQWWQAKNPAKGWELFTEPTVSPCTLTVSQVTVKTT